MSMTQQQIVNTLRERIINTVGAPDTVLENSPNGNLSAGEWDRPNDEVFWAIGNVMNPPERPGVDEWNQFSGRTIVAVLGKPGTFYDLLETSAELLIARFPSTLVLPVGTGQLKIRNQAFYDPPGGYLDGAYNRTNVQIPWQAQE